MPSRHLQLSCRKKILLSKTVVLKQSEKVQLCTVSRFIFVFILWKNLSKKDRIKFCMSFLLWKQQTIVSGWSGFENITSLKILLIHSSLFILISPSEHNCSAYSIYKKRQEGQHHFPTFYFLSSLLRIFFYFSKNNLAQSNNA